MWFLTFFKITSIECWVHSKSSYFTSQSWTLSEIEISIKVNFLDSLRTSNQNSIDISMPRYLNLCMITHCRLGVLTFKNFIQFGWGINISNNFSRVFQKCQFYRCRTHPVEAKLLSTQRPRNSSATGYVGRSLASTGFVWSKIQEGYFCYSWKTKLLSITCQNPWCSRHPYTTVDTTDLKYWLLRLLLIYLTFLNVIWSCACSVVIFSLIFYGKRLFSDQSRYNPQTIRYQ